MYKKVLVMFFLMTSFSLAEILNIRDKYNTFNLENKLDYEAFEKAYIGFIQIPEKKKDLLAIIDYSKSSSEKRFFLLDIKNEKILYISRVAHSKNSGFEIPIKFSNDPNSFESSLGFYLTLGEYNGAFGHSLRLKGLEDNINSNAEERAIVLHGGDIANESYLKRYGFLGRSLGCPVLPTDVVDEVINLIKDGAVIFINGNDENYMNNSKFMKNLVSFSETEENTDENNEKH